MPITIDSTLSRQARIAQLIDELPDRDKVKSIPRIDKLFDELLSLDPTSIELEHALDGTRLTAHMLANTLQRLAAIEKYLYRLYLERGR